VHRRGVSNADDDAVLSYRSARSLRQHCINALGQVGEQLMAGFHGPAKLLSRLGIDMAWRPGLDPSNDRLSVRVSAATSGWTVTQTDAPTPMPASNTTSGSARPATPSALTGHPKSCIRASVSPGPGSNKGFPALPMCPIIRA
jgi:hypothetical protein